ncbi:putative altered inheritance of mitochondria protein [Clavispora lusitaniae]|uniref:Altered inheritance of mitochondria protein n=1 Tax=Clavispora lusitaniae TaxID=36911 RepID=A0ACD0WHR0_CLALS|nr:putative altered inheritance of mitochondria protein [Clavispora lusitaniae]QFZ32589.1 putative altered inheritance of mitochondria protein [Clavispora lusitaniae]QFZ38258.1 putative altered inheritance of mitochondria protein [Clavispora lusitaniae]QFZ43941.1 putative altered inheritance of mitochondria protein [Clavispora lusitaniae]QFZ49618.1 putative altered inheritance of mitochondria protein [Clavispora lusitaniae]
MFRRVRPYSTFIDKCPPPAYDTGCTYCKVPAFPPDKRLDATTHLNGTAPSMWKHVLAFSHGVATFDTMPPKINLVPGSLASEFEVLRRKMLSPQHPVTLSNAIVSGIDGGTHQKVFIYPDCIQVEFKLANLPEFIQHYLLPVQETESVFNPFASANATPHTRVERPHLFQETPIHKDLVLICGHTQRDIRCGRIAPLLLQEFERVLAHEKLDVDVGLVSHIGGHAYAGNVIYFSKHQPPVWYGRVFPEQVQGIVRETIVEGRIIKELYRGQTM